MANKSNSGYGLYVSYTTFVTQLEGVDITVEADKSLIEEGSELHVRYPQLLRPATPHFPKKRVAPDVEQATASPGERRA